MNEIQSRRLAANSLTPEDMFWEVYAEQLLPLRLTRKQMEWDLRCSLFFRERWSNGRRPITRLEASMMGMV